MRSMILSAGAAGLIAALLVLTGAEEGKAPGLKKARERKAPVTVALIRHAEKEADGKDKDPGLTEPGSKRAERLAAIFARAKVDALIASDRLRTRKTLEPLAHAKKLEIAAIAEPADVVQALEKLPPGSLAVVCHHSNTVDLIARGLGVPRFDVDSVEFEAYDNLLLVAFHPDIEPRLIHLTY